MGLGDVYLGAPVATPSIPVIAWSPPNTTPHAPGRRRMPWASAAPTSAFMAWKALAAISSLAAPCKYGTPISQTADFAEGKPWLLRFFDQVRFYPVSDSELLKLRQDFVTGHFKLRVEETTFSLKQYNEFLKENAASISAFKARQQAAFEAERERWAASGQAEYVSETVLEEADTQSELDLPAGAHAITAHVTGTIWKLLVAEGDRVEAGSPALIIESMKMEFPVNAAVNGTIGQFLCKEGTHVSAGQMLFVIQESQ